MAWKTRDAKEAFAVLIKRIYNEKHDQVEGGPEKEENDEHLNGTNHAGYVLTSTVMRALPEPDQAAEAQQRPD